VLVDGEGRVTAAVEDGAVVVPGADAVEDLVPGEGATLEEGATGGTATDGALLSTGGAGGMTVAGSDGEPFRGAVAVDSTEVTGGAGGGGGTS
jgi:hypothetical protein